MRRIVLLLTAVTLIVSMVLISALSSIAQENDPPSEEAPFEDTTDKPSFEDDYPWEDEPSFEDDYPWEDEPSFEDDYPWEDEPPFEDTTDEPPVEDEPPFEDVSGQETPLCAPEWLQEWYPDWASGWWYFYWFQYCYTDQYGWYRVYDGWDWGPPIW